MPLYERIADLPLEIGAYALEGRSRRINDEFERRHHRSSTSRAAARRARRGRHLRPGRAAVPAGPRPGAAARGRLDVRLVLATTSAGSTCSRRRPTCPRSATTAAGRTSRAALDLALRQAGPLARRRRSAATREPISFVVSLRLGEPPSADPVTRRLAAYPGTALQARPVARLGRRARRRARGTGAVASIDFKGAYKGTPVDTPTDPGLYRRFAEGFPDAWLEDPDLTVPEADAALRPYRDRITWDAPIHSRRGHRGAAVRAAHDQPQAVAHRAAARRSSTPTTAAPSAASSPTAAGSPSWASGAARSSTSRRSSIPTSRTTSRPPATTGRVPGDRPARAPARPGPRRHRLPPALVD